MLVIFTKQNILSTQSSEFLNWVREKQRFIFASWKVNFWLPNTIINFLSCTKTSWLYVDQINQWPLLKKLNYHGEGPWAVVTPLQTLGRLGRVLLPSHAPKPVLQKNFISLLSLTSTDHRAALRDLSLHLHQHIFKRAKHRVIILPLTQVHRGRVALSYHFFFLCKTH